MIRPAHNKLLLLALSLSCVSLTRHPSALAQPPQPRAQQRAAWTTSRIAGSPEAPLPYVTERAFPALKFNQCLDIAAAPGSERLFVVEQSGKIFSFPNRPDVAAADLVVDLAKEIPGVRQVYSLAFHPDFQRNRHCYVCYILDANRADGTHVARFQMSDSDPPTIDASSETTIITWLSGGHNGCSLKFGPDGCLYISTGDGGPANPPDPLKTGQDLGDLLSSILRIDVDHADAGKSYRIPVDNPYVGTPGARGEVWAYGLRNPWRISFDRQTGDLWAGDVGWELWEMLYRIERGGNYGWAVSEGRQSTKPEWPRGPTPILPPTIDHPHTESSSITEGLTYYGTRLPELRGVHLYGDYDTGKIWGFRYKQGQVVDHRELADTSHRIVGFGEDHQGAAYLLDHTAGTLHRLAPNPRRGAASSFPRALSETGLFASVVEQIPAAGVVPYTINAAPWADHASGERLVAVPQQLAIGTAGKSWSFPLDSVLVKTLSLEMRRGDPASRRRVETQILHFDGSEWMPYTYQWNEQQTDATLVGAAGAELRLEVVDPAAAGGTRQQTWRFAGRAECQRCHNKWSGPPLGFNVAQLDTISANSAGDGAPRGAPSSQLDTLAQLGLLEPPAALESGPRLANPTDESAELADRARAYLHANCAHCHRLHAGGAVLSHLHFDLPLDKTNTLAARPSQGTFGIHAAQVIAPGDPFRSVLLYRIAKLGSGRMPHIGSTEVDLTGVSLIHDWIQQLPPDLAPAGDTAAAGLRGEQTAALAQLAAASPAEQPGIVERLLGSTSGALSLLPSIDRGQLPQATAALAIQQAAQRDDANVRDLFERFLPPDQRIQRLGSAVQAEQILALPGDPQRGRQVFLGASAVSCKNCHRVGDQGVEIGPDLTTIGRKLSLTQLLESVLEPSKRIDPQYVTYLAETDDGRLLTGLLVEKGDDVIVLKDPQNKLIRIPAKGIERLVPQAASLMPDLLLRDMTAQQVADLLAFLRSLQ